jgi:hypothetical protein
MNSTWTNEETDRLINLVQSQNLVGKWDEVANSMHKEGYPLRTSFEYANKLQNQTMVSRVIPWTSIELHLLCNLVRKTYENEKDIRWQDVAQKMSLHTGVQRSVRAYSEKWRNIKGQCGENPPIRIKIENPQGEIRSVQRPSLLQRDEEEDLDESDILENLPRKFTYTLCILGPDWYGNPDIADQGHFTVDVDLTSWHKPKYFTPGEALKQLCINKEHRDEPDVENLWAWIQSIRDYLKEDKKFVVQYPSKAIVFLINPRNPLQLKFPSPSSLQNESILPNPYSFRGLRPGAKIYPFITSYGSRISKEAENKMSDD